MANPPPPYSDITGTSAIIGKYNQQETIAEADGNARPGQLVVNLVTDPPELYIGNNNGNLSLVTGGGSAGLPLANGTSNFNIATSGGNVTITADTSDTWTFDTNGNLTIPGSIRGLGTILIDNRDTGTSADIELYSADNIIIQGKNQDPGPEREGGDIQITGGRGTGGSDGTGGDISIVSGAGGNATDSVEGGDGGFVTIGCTSGGEANSAGSQLAGAGSNLQLYAGAGGFNDGDPTLGANGGDVSIRGGNSTRVGGGGAVNIAAGVDDADTPSNIVFGAGRSKELAYKELYASLVFTPVTFATLGSAATAGAGARAFVNDSNLAAATNFAAQITGGGANTVPVWSNGTNWLIG